MREILRAPNILGGGVAWKSQSIAECSRQSGERICALALMLFEVEDALNITSMMSLKYYNIVITCLRCLTNNVQ